MNEDGQMEIVMELKKIKLLKELEKRYGYDIAQMGQTEHECLNSPDERLQALLYLKLSDDITTSINDYIDNTDSSDKDLNAVNYLLLKTIMTIINIGDDKDKLKALATQFISEKWR